MTLANLLKIGRLKTHVPNGAEIRRLLAALRRKRNAADYLGDPVETEALAECVKQAGYLHVAVETWLRGRHPGLLNEN